MIHSSSGIGAHQHVLALHPQLDQPVDLIGGLPPAHRGHHRAGVVLGLEQAVDDLSLVDPQRGGLGLQSDVDAEAGWQHAVPDGPPALAVPFPGHLQQDLALARIVDAVELEHGVEIGGPRRRLAGLDPGQRGRRQAEPLGDLLKLDRLRLPQPS